MARADLGVRGEAHHQFGRAAVVPARVVQHTGAGTRARRLARAVGRQALGGQVAAVAPGQPLHHAAQPAQPAVAIGQLGRGAADVVHDDRGGADVQKGQCLVPVVLQVTDPPVQHVGLGVRGDRGERLGAQPDHDALPVVVRHRARPDVVPGQVERLFAEVQRDVAVQVDVDRRLQQVHPGAAQERGHVERRRPAVHLGRRADVLQHATAHDGHPVRHGQRLGLVVRDVDRAHAQLPDQAGDLGPKLRAQATIQVGQWLVHQEQPWPADDGAAHRHALALATGELVGLAGQHVADAQRGGHVGHPLAARPRVHTRQSERERDVVPHGHVRVQREVLEHHGDAPLAGRQIIGQLAIEQDRAAGRVLQPGDHTQHRGLAAAGRPEQHHEFAVADVQAYVVDRHRPVRENFGDVLERDGCHRLLPMLRPPSSTGPKVVTVTNLMVTSQSGERSMFRV